MFGRANWFVKGWLEEKTPGSQLLTSCGQGAWSRHFAVAEPEGSRDLLPAEAEPRSRAPSPWPVPRRRRPRAEPPFRALGTGALGSVPRRGGAQGGGAACTERQGRGEVRVRSPRTCTWKHSSRKCKHLRERDGEVVSGTSKRGARVQTLSRKVRRAGRQSWGHTDRRPGRVGSPARERLQASAGGGR